MSKVIGIDNIKNEAGTGSPGFPYGANITGVATARVSELEEWGALFDRTKEGLIAQRNFGGHRYPRLAHVGDRTGLELLRTLQNHGIHQGFEVYMECCVVELIKENDQVCGAFGFWRESGQFVVFKAKSVILATGGLG